MPSSPGWLWDSIGRFGGRDIRRRTVLPLLSPELLMLKVKDTLRSTVYLSFDGRVIKTYHGPDAASRYATEVTVLRYLEERGCPFVPRLLSENPVLLQIVTTNCGQRVEHLDSERLHSLFAELEAFGVRHDDQDARNVTYRKSDGRFCIIDFEFATLLAPTSPEAP